MSLPKVLILGRANVGKSTLFNRLSSTRQALVSPRSGTTRDRKETVVSWSGKEITLVDSGGLDVNTQDPIEREIAKQALKGLQESDLILFVVDTKVGITPQDTEIATWLRKQKAQVIVVANKADSLKWRQASAEFQQFGLGDPLPVSAANGSGTGDLLDEVMKLAKASDVKEVNTIKVAIIGKPNVGKSSLINALVNDERVIKIFEIDFRNMIVIMEFLSGHNLESVLLRCDKSKQLQLQLLQFLLHLHL
jgi:GTP-binding protein